MLEEEDPEPAAGDEAGPTVVSNQDNRQQPPGGGGGGERRVAGKTFFSVMLGIIALFILLAMVILVVLYFMHDAKKHEVEDDDKDDAKSRGRSTQMNPKFDYSRKEYQTWCLNEHNRLRKLHQGPPVKLSTQITKKAFKCAQYYMKVKKTDHSCPYKMMEPKDCDDECGPYGENLFLATGNKVVGTEMDMMKKAMETWYRQVENYDFQRGNPVKRGKKVRHFTQMVWTEVVEIGAAVLMDKDTAVVEVLYNPEGNIPDEYTMYVKPKA